jgi:uncharacterized protein (TIGR02265 family)
MSTAQQEPVVFADAVQGFRKSLGARFTPEVEAEFLRLGFDFKKLQVAYPLNQWVQGLKVLAAKVATDVPEAQRIRHLGRIFMKGFVETPVGFAALTAARVFGVRRTLLRMGRNFRTATNYSFSEEREVGPKEVQLRVGIAPEFLPQVTERGALFAEYRQGVLEGVLDVLGAKGTVELLRADLDQQDFTYRVTWE